MKLAEAEWRRRDEAIFVRLVTHCLTIHPILNLMQTNPIQSNLNQVFAFIPSNLIQYYPIQWFTSIETNLRLNQVKKETLCELRQNETNSSLVNTWQVLKILELLEFCSFPLLHTCVKSQWASRPDREKLLSPG